MLTRSRYIFGLSAILSTMTFVAPASAQYLNLGQRFESQLPDGTNNPLVGAQPMYRSPSYGMNQPYASPYPGRAMSYGPPVYQSQAGMRYNRRSLPFFRGGRNAFQQAGTYYQRPALGYNQQSVTTRTRPRYDQQFQPTSYTAPVVQRYQIPANYAGTPAGYVITYGGRNYLSGSDGTMTPYNGPVAPR